MIPKWIVLLIPLGLFALCSYEKKQAEKRNLPYLFSLIFILITGFFVLKNTPQFGLLIPLGLFALCSYEKKQAEKRNLPYLFSLIFILITGFFVLKNTPQFGNDYLWVYLYHALKKGIVGVIGIRFLFHSEANKNLPQDYILEIAGVILLLLPLIMTMTLPWFWILVLAVIGEICITNRKKAEQKSES